MTIQSQHADEDELQMLLFDDESNGELAGISTHVESCQTCQTRLRRLAATDDEDQEVRNLLSDFGSPRRMAGSQENSAVSSSAAKQGDAQQYLNPPSHPELLGRLGRYEIECEIGSGGMGVVFKGFDTELNRPVAIKVLAQHLARCGAARQRFGRESRAAAAVVHEHVVAIHNVESDGETPFLVMQFVAGESLQARVERVGPLSVAEVLRIGIQTSAGLAAAHEQGIVHRDIKPANILLEHGVERVLLTDFGLARTVDEASLTQTGIVAGTPHYMSPEQANGDVTDHRTDLFSLGSVLYFVATGHPPFRAERAMGILHRICRDQHRPAWQVNPAIPDELSDVIDRMLEKRPSRRFSSATATREALVRLLNQLQQPRRSVLSHVRNWRRRHSAWIKTGLVAAVMLAIASTASSLLQSKLDSTQEVSHAAEPLPIERPAVRPLQQAATPAADLIAEVLPSEQAGFTRQLEQLDRELQALETMHLSEFRRPAVDDFQQETQSIQKRLDRLRTFTPEPSSR
jgi:serine/threonine protein kinase